MTLTTLKTAPKKKSPRVSGAEYLKIKAEAESASGYHKANPVWGRPLIDVLVEVTSLIADARRFISTGDLEEADASLALASDLASNLQRRQARRTLIQTRLRSV